MIGWSVTGLPLSAAMVALAAANVPLGILLGLCAALAWGLSDFLMRGVSRSGGSPLRALWGISLAAALGLSCVLPFGNTLARLAQSPMPVVGLAALLGVLLVLANWFLYRAFARGSVSLVAPIANSHAAVTVLISLLAGARFAFPALGAIGLICGGVALSSLPAAPPSLPWWRRDQACSPFSSSLTETGIAWKTLALVASGSPQLSWASRGSEYMCASAHPRPIAALAPVAAGVHACNGGEARLSTITQRTVTVPYADSRPITSPIDEGSTGARRAVAIGGTFRVLAPGVAEALVSAVLLGVAFWAMQFIAPLVGATATAWVIRAASAVALGIWVGAGRLRAAIRPQHGLSGRAQRFVPAALRPNNERCWCRPRIVDAKCIWLRWSPIAGVGLLDALATVAFGVGVSMISAAMVATPASLSPVITVALGCVVLRERLSKHQLGGVLMALSGVLVLSAISS
ncbi:MAG TPA: EamA family transporter [Ktedonobacterales bacterium]|nr:EamA family transporter [Ktedonobacterales bacterium]